MDEMTADQIEAARAAGIIPDDQAARMTARLDPAPTGKTSRTGNTQIGDPQIGDEENLRFFRSFSDIFITIGVALLMAATWTVVARMSFGGNQVVGAGVAAAIFFAMSEYFGRVRRANLPTLVLSIGYAISLYVVVTGLFIDDMVNVMIGASGGFTATLSAAGLFLIGVALYYWRIRLPFCFVILAWGVIGFVMATVAAAGLWDNPRILVALWFALGVATVALALAYDVRDPERVRRWSDNAFWLHSVASPVLVTGAIGLGIVLFNLVGIGGADSLLTFRNPEAIMGLVDRFMPWVFVVVVASMLFGLAVNRRVFVISTLVYAVGTLIYALSKFDVDAQTALSVGLATVGAVVVFLGVGWHPARRALLRVLPNWAIFPDPELAADG